MTLTVDRRARWLTVGLGLLLVGYTLALAVFKVMNWDVWFHLAYGREVFNRGGLPELEPFTVAGQGRVFENPEWLFGVILYLTHRLGGISAVVLLKATILALGFLVIFLDARGPRRATTIAFLVTGVAVLAARGRFYERPESFIALFLPLVLLLLDRFTRTGSRWVWCIPVLTLVWVNIHPSAILALLLVSAWFGVGSVLGLIERATGHRPEGALDRRRGLTLAGVLAATVAASALTPYGALSLKHAVAFVMPYLGLAAQAPADADFAKHYILELLPLNLSTIGPSSPLTLLVLLAGLNLLVVLLLKIWRQWRSGEKERRVSRVLVGVLSVNVVRVALACGAVIIALGARRFLALAAILLVPPAARALADILELEKTRSRWATALGGLAVICLLAAGGRAIATDTSAVPGLGVSPAKYPGGAVRYMLAQGVKGPLLNTFHFGGYIEWKGFPKLRPVWDGRAFVDQALFVQLLGAPGNLASFRSMEKRFKPEAALFEFPGIGPDTAQALERGLPGHLVPTGWRLVYWDDTGYVLVREGGPNGAIAKRDGLTEIDLVRDYHLWGSRAIWDRDLRARLLDEVKRSRARAPDAIRPALIEAKVAFYTGDVARAKHLTRWIKERIGQGHPRDMVIQLAFLEARLADGQGLTTEAIAAYSRVIALDPHSRAAKQAQHRIADLLLQTGKRAEAINVYTNITVLDPNDTKALQRLVELYRTGNDPARAKQAEATLAKAMRHSAGASHFFKALTLQQGGQLKQAEEEYLASLKANPRNAAASSNLGYVLMQAGKPDLALERQLRAVEIDPDFAQAHYGLGLLYWKKDLKQQASTHFREYLRLVPRGPFSHRAETILRMLREG